jgi:2-polyprenyl-3-methyl-5-hydroxy-6-metoxy-1,4-benzoquinol methylase
MVDLTQPDRQPGTCGICGQALFARPLLSQHNMPAAAQGLPTQEQLSQDKGVSLHLFQCTGCGLVQLATPPVPYWRDVIRAAGISAEMGRFRRKQFGAWLTKHQLIGHKVLEIGCGQGEYLAILAQVGADAYGIEHKAESVQACLSKGLQVEQLFLENCATTVQSGAFDGFVILNFLEHIPRAHTTLKAIAAQLNDGAVGMVEVPNLDIIIEGRLFAEFIPDHLYYFTRKSLTNLLEANGFDVLACEPAWHNYVLSATVRKRVPIDLSVLHTSKLTLKHSFHIFLSQFEAQRVAVWGAGHQALALLSLMDIASHIRFVVDSAPFKQGRFTPATHIPIVAPDVLNGDDVKAIIVLAASYSDEVIRTLMVRHGNRFTVAVVRDNGLETVVHGLGR